jgi:hypothetical protein
LTGEPESDLLIEAAVTAYRELDTLGRILPSPAWWDLALEAREELFDRQLLSRIMERAVDPGGLSTTVKVVLGRSWMHRTP